MSLQIGIVGLPNVGKSTLFKALTKKAVEAENYPFTTIEPNVGVVSVPDERLTALAKVSKSQKVVPAAVEFVDIAGLVKGAAQGEGLGNKFLSHIREVDAIAEVVRVFPDPDVTHVHNKVDPVNDIEVIEAELILADLDVVSKRLGIVEGGARAGQKEAQAEKTVLDQLKDVLEKGQGARTISSNLDQEQKQYLKTLNLLTAKPIMYIVNVSEEQFKDQAQKEQAIKQLNLKPDSVAVPVSAKIESELIELTPEDQKTFLEELGLKQSGLDEIIRAAYRLLGLITFFTSGEQESRAWTVSQGATAPQAAGKIHTDFQKGFVKADKVFWQDLVDFGGWSQAREKAKVSMEGKEYVVKDGDVMLFKFTPAGPKKDKKE